MKKLLKIFNPFIWFVNFIISLVHIDVGKTPLTCPNCGCSKRYNFSRQGKGNAPVNHDRFNCYNCEHTFDLLSTHPEAIQWANDLAISDLRGTGPL